MARAAAQPPSELIASLRRLEGEPFSRYRALLGRHALGEFELQLDWVPSEPTAGPARLRLIADRRTVSIPPDLLVDPARILGAEDELAREAARALAELGFAERIPGRAHLALEIPGAAIVPRSVCRIDAERVELRLLADLPFAHRRIAVEQAETLFSNTLLRLATRSLLFSARRIELGRVSANLVEDHRALQRALSERGLVAFIADGSLLARAGRTSDAPRKDGREVPFASPETLRVALDTPHSGRLQGMGIPAGVTVLVGGELHGKSTLASAIAQGIHPHPAGDGRERVVSLPSTVAVVAEEGRSVRRVDITAFLEEAPSGAVPAEFTTEDASGALSTACSIAEALEAGARCLVVDEDRSAASFLVRDGRMQRLVPRPGATIVPLIDRVRELYDRWGVSTLIVTGGAGDWLEVADTVIRMEGYRPHEVTAEAREIVSRTSGTRLAERLPRWSAPQARIAQLDARFRLERRPTLRSPTEIEIGTEILSLGGLAQIAERAQARALGLLLARAVEHVDGRRSVIEIAQELDAWLAREGLDALDAPAAYDLARPRVFEIVAVLNRWRALRAGRARTDPTS